MNSTSPTSDQSTSPPQKARNMSERGEMSGVEYQALVESGQLPAPVPPQKPLLVVLDEMEQRANAATKGPWHTTTHEWSDGGVMLADRFVSSENTEMNPVLVKIAWNGNDDDELTRRAKADQSFIAAARSDVPALVKALRYAMDALSILHGDHGEEPVIEFAALTQLLTSLQKRPRNETRKFRIKRDGCKRRGCNTTD